jgi:hypothetical protein
MKPNPLEEPLEHQDEALNEEEKESSNDKLAQV